MKTTSLIAAAFAAVLPLAAFAADHLSVGDAVALSTGPSAQTGAVYMVIENRGTEDDALLSASSPAAARVELHRTVDAGGGVMKMEPVASLDVPAGGKATLEQGGNHLMFMGLTHPWVEGERIPLTLVFEKAGEMTIEVPVGGPAAMEMQGHGHGAAHGGT